jgi:copper chaperone CopZ
MKQYIHSVPGRLRIKTSIVKRNPSMAKHVEKFMSQLRGVKSVYSNPTTGSVLVRYDSKTINSNTILDTFKTFGLINKTQIISLDEHINETASKAGHALRKIILGTVVENIIENSALSFIAPLLILI